MWINIFHGPAELAPDEGGHHTAGSITVDHTYEQHLTFVAKSDERDEPITWKNGRRTQMKTKLTEQDRVNVQGNGDPDAPLQ